MAVLMLGSCMLGLSFIIHLITWRIRRPHRQTIAILAIFLGVLLAGIIFLLLDFVSHDRRLNNLLNLCEVIQLILYCGSMTMAYVITYSAIEVDSPSLVIIKQISDSGSNGLTEKELLGSLDDSKLIMPRLSDLIHDKMATFNKHKFVLTNKGKCLGFLFKNYRALLRLGKGG